MHDPSATGNDYFKCDFCRRSWSEDRPMIEGHQGSLICAPCLSAAYVELVAAARPNQSAGETHKCNMCLMDRGPDEPCWASPLVDSAWVCRACVEQGADTLESDEDYQWKRPATRAS